jgi:hypothetical protein
MHLSGLNGKCHLTLVHSERGMLKVWISTYAPVITEYLLCPCVLLRWFIPADMTCGDTNTLATFVVDLTLSSLFLALWLVFGPARVGAPSNISKSGNCDGDRQNTEKRKRRRYARERTLISSPDTFHSSRKRILPFPLNTNLRKTRI